MAALYVLQAGRNQWSDANRIESAVGVPLSEAGAAAIQQIAEELADKNIEAIYAPPGESERQTAQIVAGKLKVRTRTNEDLRELDYGLWQGLLVSEVKQRYAKVYRQWQEAPLTACPPGGECFPDAQERLCQAVARILKRHRGRSVLLVLQPVAAALLKCRLFGLGCSAVWENVDLLSTWTSYETDRLDFEEQP
jgi:phosphoserine phosphatase